MTEAAVDQPKISDFLRNFHERCTGSLRKRNSPEDANNISEHSTQSGIAALSICEAILPAMNDAKVLPEREIIGVLEDTAAKHDNLGATDVEIKEHKAVARLIEKFILAEIRFGDNDAQARDNC
jgi:hypothetical protein